jgi:CHAT domain-containing protein
MKTISTVLLFWGLLGLLPAQTCLTSANQSTGEAFRKGDFPLAEVQAADGIACAEKSGDPAAQFDFLMRRYEALRNQRKFNDALAAALNAESFFQKNQTGRSRLPLEIALAEAYCFHKDSSNCLRHLQTAQALLAQNPAAPATEQAWLRFVQGYWEQHFLKKTETALTAYREALQMLQSEPEQAVFLQGQILRWLGNTARSQGDFQQALAHYGQELDLYKKHYPPSQPDLAICHYNLGSTHYELLHHQQALDHYLLCWAVWQKTFEPGSTYYRFLTEAIGDMYWELGDRQKALEFYDRSVQNVPSLSRDSSILLAATADSLLQAGEPNAAHRYYLLALDFRIRNFGEKHALTAACQNFIGRSLAASGKTSEALAAYHRSVHLLSDRFDDPSPFANPGSFDKTGSLHLLLEALAGKGILLLKMAENGGSQSELRAAHETLQLAISCLRQMQRSPMTEASKQFWNRNSQPLLEAALRAALLLYQRTGERPYLETAFAISEKSRDFLLTAALQGEQALRFAGVPTSLTDQERSLRNQILDYEHKIAGEEQRCADARQKQLELWREKSAALKTEYGILTDRLQKEHPRYFSFKYGAEPIGLSELQTSLGKERAALLEFFEGEKRRYVFYVDARRAEVFELENNADFQALVSGFVQLLHDRERFLRQPAEAWQAFTTAARSLYGALLERPLRDCPATVERLLLVPGHGLSAVPFACLLTADLPEGTDRDYRQLPYLLRRFSVFYAPSASVWQQAFFQKKKGKSNARYAGFAPDYAGAAYPGMAAPAPLLFSKKEVEAGASVFGGEVFFGKNATEQAFRRQSARLLHLAAHALPDEANPLLSKLLLLPADTSEDGLLHAYEVYGLQLPAQLAFLGACHTAAGQYERGEGLMSLERAFQYAGCPSLLSSLWAADDAAAAMLASFFWENIAAGLPKDVALQQAQLRFLQAGDPALAAPCYWGGWRLSGEAGAVESAGMRWWWMVLGGVVLIWVGWRARRRLSSH